MSRAENEIFVFWRKINTLYLYPDIDFLIAFKNDIRLEEYADNYFALMFELDELFGRNVDLVPEKTLSNPYLIRSIEETKQLIYAAWPWYPH